MGGRANYRCSATQQLHSLTATTGNPFEMNEAPLLEADIEQENKSVTPYLIEVVAKDIARLSFRDDEANFGILAFLRRGPPK
ncbi:hypothetical protein Q9L58_010961 [Maublancomyces gigas]|uniref:Uncharacterized protein n=1 Tax=Discina gigas TaxID=1032678 RepID=A0ABR3G2L6_9PEZI